MKPLRACCVAYRKQKFTQMFKSIERLKQLSADDEALRAIYMLAQFTNEELSTISRFIESFNYHNSYDYIEPTPKPCLNPEKENPL